MVSKHKPYFTNVSQTILILIQIINLKDLTESVLVSLVLVLSFPKNCVSSHAIPCPKVKSLSQPLDIVDYALTLSVWYANLTFPLHLLRSSSIPHTLHIHFIISVTIVIGPISFIQDLLPFFQGVELNRTKL